MLAIKTTKASLLVVLLLRLVCLTLVHMLSMESTAATLRLCTT